LTAPETPKRRRENASKRLPGIKTQLPANLSLESIRTRLVETLGLSYTPDDWQVHLIRRILQGYDSIFCAGTGYGKSLIFEALAVLGGQGKLVIVISPLKALEHDQADQATAKGIEAVVVNEDTTKTTNLWKKVRSTAAMVYMSPEMALSDSFQKLWKDSRFRKRLTAAVVDEAHCIDEWGDDTFQ
jgi:superfamily II DNA helicase RecQ